MRLKKELDREQQDEFNIPITATDGGGKSSVATLKVIVLDVGDNAPVFKVSLKD